MNKLWKKRKKTNRDYDICFPPLSTWTIGKEIKSSFHCSTFFSTLHFPLPSYCLFLFMLFLILPFLPSLFHSQNISCDI